MRLLWSPRLEGESSTAEMRLPSLLLDHYIPTRSR